MFLYKYIISFLIFCFLFSVIGLESSKTKEAKFYLAGLAISDTESTKQWHLQKINAPDAWLKTQGTEDIVIAVIDTGIDLDHPELKNNLWRNTDEVPDNGIDDDNNGYIDDVYGWNFVEKNNSPEPDPRKKYEQVAINHGTAVAGIIAAEGNNAFAGTGIAWHAKLMPLRVFDNIGESDSFLVEQAIQYAVDNGADIINMSFVGLGYAPSLESKIRIAYEAGVLLVAAAGNEGGAEVGSNLDEVKSYPVCHDGPAGENWVLGVASVDETDKKADFSNFGNNCIDITAPGTGIYTSLFYDSALSADFNKYFGGKFNGTSMSAPQVVGAASLLKTLHPQYTNKELMQVLMSSADGIDNLNSAYQGQLGSGRLNIAAALDAKTISNEEDEEKIIKYILSAKAGDEPKIWLLDSKGSIVKEFFAFARAFRGGVNVAVGDIDNDGAQEIITGAGYGGGPHVRIFNLKGELEEQFFAFDSSRRKGVNVAVGDIDGNRVNEIIAVEAGMTRPIARIFNKNGKIVKDSIEIFENYFNDSISLAIGDVNKDGKEEIIAGAPYGFRNKIKVLDASGEELGEFSPFEAGFYGGVNVAVGDLNNDGWAEIIASRASSGNSIVKTYTFTGRLLSPGFIAYNNYRYGVNLFSGDRDSDGDYEIMTAPDGLRSTEVKIWDKNLNLKMSFFPFGKDIYKKINVYIITR
ncbi:S8 family serine peptidase [Patescibacteria group bacterium]